MHAKPRRELEVLHRAIDILEAMASRRKPVGLNELSRTLRLPPGTVHRILQVLSQRRLVWQDGDRRYLLGGRLAWLAAAATASLELTRVALPVMEELRDRTGECAHLNVREGWERVCLASLEGTLELRCYSPVAQRSPLHAGGSAKLLLAYLPPEELEAYLSRPLEAVTDLTITDPARLRLVVEEIRRRGYVVSFGERVPGVWTIAAPIRDWKGGVIAALGVSFPDVRYSKEKENALVRLVVESADRISQALGYGSSGGESSGKESE